MVNKNEVRILFLGTPEISAFVLERLIIANYNVIGVVAQEDKPIGRGNKIEEVPTKIIAKKYNIPVYQFKKLKEHYDEILNINPELIITLAYGQIVSHEILEIPKYGCLNLHGSILPKYRGAAPMQYSLLNGDKSTGVSLMQMVDKMDAGKVYSIKEFILKDDDNFDSLVKKMEVACFECLDENLNSYLNGELVGVEQNEEEATFTKKITKDDELIDFSNDAFKVHNKIRALSSKPGAYFKKGETIYKVLKSELISDIKDIPGKILKYNKDEFVISCLNGAIKICIIQKQGKKAMDYKSFYNGNSKIFAENEIL